SLLERAGVAADALAPAAAAHVIERENGSIRFTQPPPAAGPYGGPGARRREGAGAAADARAPAAAPHVIERENGSIRFTHPLLSSVLYGDLGARRRSVHRRIAAIGDDPLPPHRHPTPTA